MKRINMENTIKIENCPDLNAEELRDSEETMQLTINAKEILYLGGYDYSIDEIMSITACAGIIAIDEGKSAPPGTPEEFVNINNKMHQVMKELRESGDQEHIDMIAEAKEYVEQFQHDMQESIKTLQRNNLIPGSPSMVSHPGMYV